MADMCKIGMRWQVVHGFYDCGLCKGMELSVASPSRGLLRRRGLRFERTGVNEWILWGKEEGMKEEEEITLELKVTDSDLFYVTEGEICNEYTFPLQAREEAFVLNFRPKRMTWEYVLLSRTGRETGQLELVDESGQLVFSEPEEVLFRERRAVRMETKEKVAFGESYGYELHLYEKRAFGKKKIGEQLGFPEPEDRVDEERARKIVYF